MSNKAIFRSTLVVSLMTILSRMLGFVRDIFLAAIFGAGVGLDVFLVAFKLPNLMRRLFAEGAFSQAFIPILAEYKSNKSNDELNNFIANVFAWFILILSVVCIIAIIFAPLIMSIVAPGFIEDQFRLSLGTDLLRITFTYLLFISLVAFSSAILNSYGIFWVPAITPLILNLTIIICMLFAKDYFSKPIFVLAWSVLLSGVFQYLFHIPFLYKVKSFIRPRFNDFSGVKKIFKGILPAIFGVSVAQINLLVDTMFASFLVSGSISWLYFSDRLIFFPLGVIAVAISTVALPNLSKATADNNSEKYNNIVDWSLRSVLLLGLPSAIGISLLSEPLLYTLLQYDKFTDYDVSMTKLSLQAFSFGLPAFMLVKILGASFYAKKQVKVVVNIAIICMIANVIFSFILVNIFAHTGLALSTSLASYINAFGLGFLLVRKGYYKLQKGWGTYTFKLFFVNLSLVIWLLLIRDMNWQQMIIKDRIFNLSLILISAVSVYSFLCFLLGIRFNKNISAKLQTN